MLRTTHWVLGAWIILCGGAVVQAGPMFMGLGFPGYGTGVSADGRVVVGFGAEAFRWTQADGKENLGVFIPTAV